MENLVKVKHYLVEKAWENWVDAHYGLDCEEVMERFFKMLDPELNNPGPLDPWGDPEDEDGKSLLDEDKNTSCFPDVAARINMLSGPHFRTFVAAHYARHPWK